jgi:hypothetical protein
MPSFIFEDHIVQALLQKLDALRNLRLGAQ